MIREKLKILAVIRESIFARNRDLQFYIAVIRDYKDANSCIICEAQKKTKQKKQDDSSIVLSAFW